MNLFSNSLKFTLKGYVKIHWKFDKYYNSILISIRDSGIGI